MPTSDYPKVSEISAAKVPAKATPRRVEVPELPSILVDDFEIGLTQGLFSQRKNRLDAFQGTWAKRPSFTVITKAPDDRTGRSGQTLKIEYSKTGGWCGWYTLLNGINVADYNALTFWIKGEKGGERFDVGLADERMQRLGIDAVYVGTIKAFLPSGVTTEWQQVKVPLMNLKSELDLSQMGSLVFWFRYEGSGNIYVDDVQFTSDLEVAQMQEHNLPSVQADPSAPRATWMWKLDPVHDLQVRLDLFEFCKRASLQEIYLFMGEESIAEAPESYHEALAEFMRAAHAQGVTVQALTGNPLWAKEEHHALLLEWIRGFLEYNAKRPPIERLDGIHLDVEPYLLGEWAEEKESLKTQYVALLKKCRQLVDSFDLEDFEMGVAIPVFFDREGDFERQILEQLDYVALMDYYDTASDVIEHAI